MYLLTHSLFNLLQDILTNTLNFFNDFLKKMLHSHTIKAEVAKGIKETRCPVAFRIYFGLKLPAKAKGKKKNLIECLLFIDYNNLLAHYLS